MTARPLETRRTRSLGWFVCGRVLGFMVPALLLVFVVTSQFSYNTIEQHLDDSIQNQLKTASKTLETRFSNTRNWLDNLSQNGLVVNSFVDPVGAGIYIPQLFKTLTVPGPQNGGHLTLTDFKGDIIASNDTNDLNLMEPWLDTVFSGQVFERIDAQGLLIARPILVNGLPEGALILHFNPRTLSRFLRVATINGIVGVTSAENLLISAPENQNSFKEGTVFDEANHQDWAILQADIPETQGLHLITAQEKDIVFEPAEDVKAAMIAFIAIALGGIAVSLSLASRLIADHLRQFATKIRKIRNENDLSLRLDTSQITEVSVLESSFNELMNALEDTTVSKDYIDALFQGLPLPVFVLNADGKINRQNSHARKLLTNRTGQPPVCLQDTISEKSIDKQREFLVRDPHYAPQSECDILLHLPRTTDHHDMEVELHHGADITKTCILSTTALRGPGGDLVGFISAATDIQERKENEKEIIELAEANKLMARAIEEIDLGVTISDSTADHHPIIFCNSAFQKLCGRPKEDIIGQSCAFMQGPETDQDTVNQISAALADQRSITVDIQNYRQDRSPFWNELSLNPIFSNENKLKYYVGIQKDISARKRVEAMKKEFISTVSHELRTPLTAIHGSLGLINVMKDKEPDSQEKKLLAVAYRNSERLKFLINDILDTEKLDAGAMRLERDDHPLRELLEHCIILNTPFAEKYAVSFEVKDPVPDLSLSCDKNRMSQVFTNLMSNAAKFSHSGQTVELSATASNDTLNIHITDFGEGISEDFKQDLFKKFAKQHASDDADKPGTGLGLYISQKIVEAHGGELSVESQQGKGSTFTMTFPLNNH